MANRGVFKAALQKDSLDKIYKKCMNLSSIFKNYSDFAWVSYVTYPLAHSITDTNGNL